MRYPGTGSIREDLDERETETIGYRLRNSLPETIRPARVASRDTSDRFGGPFAVQLPDEVYDQLGRLTDQPRVQRALSSFQGGDVVDLRACRQAQAAIHPTSLRLKTIGLWQFVSGTRGTRLHARDRQNGRPRSSPRIHFNGDAKC